MSSFWRTHVPVHIQQLGDRVLDAAFRVHRHLGPGFTEPVYQRCLAIALANDGVPFEREVWLPVEFEGSVIPDAQRVDFLIAGELLVELKAVEEMLPLHAAQLIGYLKVSGRPAGLLLNFNVQHFRAGYDRLVHPQLLPPRGSAGSRSPAKLSL